VWLESEVEFGDGGRRLPAKDTVWLVAAAALVC
jgi:hypothetical protein